MAVSEGAMEELFVQFAVNNALNSAKLVELKAKWNAQNAEIRGLLIVLDAVRKQEQELKRLAAIVETWEKG